MKNVLVKDQLKLYRAPLNNTVVVTGKINPQKVMKKRPTVDVTGHKAHGAVPEIGAIVIARVTKVMARMASADIMCAQVPNLWAQIMPHTKDQRTAAKGKGTKIRPRKVREPNLEKIVWLSKEDSVRSSLNKHPYADKETIQLPTTIVERSQS
ncbi:hypothetical protein Fot_24208 [Forsythia ovata]|uniref:Uncharacterized protein n=1 Tax=Forsythia ovata TaxID=205694 RepID=A0ABD1U5L0_9LAMI